MEYNNIYCVCADDISNKIFRFIEGTMS